MKIETLYSFETSVGVQQATQRYIPEDRIFPEARLFAGEPQRDQTHSSKLRVLNVKHSFA
jgi:hypothetical protein